MASISRRPDGVWRARYRDDAGRERSRHFRRKVDAQRWLDEVTTSILTGLYANPKAGRVTFASYYQGWSARQVWCGPPACRSTGRWPPCRSARFRSDPFAPRTSRRGCRAR